MDYHVWFAYVVTAIVFSLAPGSGTVNSISNGLSYGTRKSLAAIAGLQIGLAIHIVLVGAGIGALVAQSALAFSVIKWVGWCTSFGLAFKNGEIQNLYPLKRHMKVAVQDSCCAVRC